MLIYLRNVHKNLMTRILYIFTIKHLKHKMQHHLGCWIILPNAIKSIPRCAFYPFQIS